MHGPINVKSPNNTNKWQVGFNSGFKGLKCRTGNIGFKFKKKYIIGIVLVDSKYDDLYPVM
jgi:hypothetical protein